MSGKLYPSSKTYF